MAIPTCLAKMMLFVVALFSFPSCQNENSKHIGNASRLDTIKMIEEFNIANYRGDTVKTNKMWNHFYINRKNYIAYFLSFKSNADIMVDDEPRVLILHARVPHSRLSYDFLLYSNQKAAMYWISALSVNNFNFASDYLLYDTITTNIILPDSNGYLGSGYPKFSVVSSDSLWAIIENWYEENDSLNTFPFAASTMRFR